MRLRRRIDMPSASVTLNSLRARCVGCEIQHRAPARHGLDEGERVWRGPPRPAGANPGMSAQAASCDSACSTPGKQRWGPRRAALGPLRRRSTHAAAGRPAAPHPLSGPLLAKSACITGAFQSKPSGPDAGESREPGALRPQKRRPGRMTPTCYALRLPRCAGFLPNFEGPPRGDRGE